MIALGVQASVEERNVSPEQTANATRYRDMIGRTGRFLTFCGGAPTIGARMHPDPAERTALKLVRETDRGIVIRGKIGMHPSPAYAEDVYLRHRHRWAPRDVHRARQCARRHDGLRQGRGAQCKPVCRAAHRYDELDGQMWLADVLIPWEHVFSLGELPEPVVRWLIWHYLYGWLSRSSSRSASRWP